MTTQTNINKIISLIDSGAQLYDTNDGYKVSKDSLGQYLVTFTPNGYTIGLFNQDKTELNCSNLYYYVNGERVYL